jgi:hypothetical protein
MARLNLDQLSKRFHYDKEAARKSEAWFQEQTRILMNQVSPNSIMANADRRVGFLLPGHMYLYHYFPQGAKELPYYDTFPLCLPFSKDSETFTGLNLHYLPPKIRVVLLKNLLDFASNKKLDEGTRLRLSWEYIGGVSKYRGANVAVKKYRYDHMQSMFLHIPAQQWFNAVMLPLERFNMGENATFVDKKQVWQQSMRYL